MTHGMSPLVWLVGLSTSVLGHEFGSWLPPFNESNRVYELCTNEMDDVILLRPDLSRAGAWRNLDCSQVTEIPLGPVYTSDAERRDGMHSGHIDRSRRSINVASKDTGQPDERKGESAEKQTLWLRSDACRPSELTQRAGESTL
ncbi:unnamed protein product [Heligmosomoides polygyrus]|uniref:Secreted protein n=1 Tax=Heligmosomoides polygyrus TaxID=6339 RepID=A0A183G0Y6_HELPZ|nr:unnamed protein product [Heligmosomoides polygyrus]